MSSKSYNRALAIDYGTVRIGIAISDPLKLFPSTTLTIPNNKDSIEKLLQLIKEKEIDTILIGIPENRNGKITKLESEIKEFKSKLEKKIKKQILLWDEHHTSQLAVERIKESVNKKSKRQNKSLIDAQSAAIILEEYLNSLNGKNYE